MEWEFVLFSVLITNLEHYSILLYKQRMEMSVPNGGQGGGNDSRPKRGRTDRLFAAKIRGRHSIVIELINPIRSIKSPFLILSGCVPDFRGFPKWNSALTGPLRNPRPRRGGTSRDRSRSGQPRRKSINFHPIFRSSRLSAPAHYLTGIDRA